MEKQKPPLIETASRMTPEEEYMSTARIVGMHRIRTRGVMGRSRKVTLENKEYAVFKPYADPQTEDDRLRLGRYLRAERGAYLISRALGLDLVPPTVIRTINGEVGSLQKFVRGGKLAVQLTDEEIPMDERIKLAVFDNIIQTPARNRGDYILKNGRIQAIDHGLALSEYDDWGGYIMQFLEDKIVPEEVIESLRIFSSSPERQDVLLHQLTEVLGIQEAKRYIQRAVTMSKAIGEEGMIDKETYSRLVPKKDK